MFDLLCRHQIFKFCRLTIQLYQDYDYSIIQSSLHFQSPFLWFRKTSDKNMHHLLDKPIEM